MNIYEMEKVANLVLAERWRQAEWDHQLAEARRSRRRGRFAVWRQRAAAWVERLRAPRRKTARSQSESC